LDREVEGGRRVRGEIRVPGDKSISHRALILSSMASGESSIRNLSTAGDVGSTFEALQKIGVEIRRDGASVLARGSGIPGFELNRADAPVEIDCQNSGTTARLLTGLLAGARIVARLTGDRSLSERPMMRIIDPLTRFGALMEHRGGRLPIRLLGGKIRAFEYSVPVPSAQVKTALILASMFVEGISQVEEARLTRDHTERMLEAMDAGIEQTALGSGKRVRVVGRTSLVPLDFEIPGDISSAIFFVVSALIAFRSQISVKGVGLNPTRSYILELLKRMGGKIEIELDKTAPEPCGKVVAESSSLQGVSVRGEEIPLIIDEIPALACAALFAEGETTVRDAGELRVKESDRIRAVVDMVRRFGGEAEELVDGFVIRGPADARSAVVDSTGDHRIAMAASILALNAKGRSLIRGADCVSVSFPEFFALLERCTV
jgi:3-phosphoshikimate 1-carboxyvinyltransferase